MANELLATKLFVPPARPGLVSRPRLIERLQGALNCGLTLVSAPAGFGKTTLVSEWVNRIKKSTAVGWVSLDEGDNDPVRFWDYFIAALKTVPPSAGETALGLLHSEQPHPIESILTPLVNDIAVIRDDVVVVLDDYHLVEAGEVHAGVTFLLDHIPPNLHLIIATRVDPVLPIARLRGRGAMIEVGADDLRFTAQEAASLLQLAQQPALSVEDVSALNDRTEGWAVGLKLAALSLRQRKDGAAFLASFTASRRYLMDYLVEEVLKQQSSEVHDFLVNTSVLERLTAPLCDFLTGSADSAHILGKLASAFGGFVVPMDDSGRWYRYHHLFAELLRHQLEVTFGKERLTELHRRAGRWYEQSGLLDDAVHHLLAAHDWERAAHLIYDLSGSLIKRGEYDTLLNWLKLVPEETLRKDPRLCCRYAGALIVGGKLDAADAVVSRIETNASDDRDLMGAVAGLQAEIAMYRGDPARVIELTGKAISLLSPGNKQERSRAQYLRGWVLFDSGQLNEAQPVLDAAYEGALESGFHWIAAASLNFMGVIAAQTGHSRRSLELYERAIKLAEDSPASTNPRLALSSSLYERNDLDAAARHQQRVIELTRLSGEVDGRLLAYIFLARTKLAQGDCAGAVAAAAEADRLVQEPGVARADLARHAGFRVLLAVSQDDRAAILHWGDRLSEYADALPFFLCHVPVRVLIARGEGAEARERLKALYEGASPKHLSNILTRIRVYQALSASTQTEALEFLTEALEMGESGGHVRCFADEGKLLAPLLQMALSRGVAKTYTARLLSVIRSEQCLNAALHVGKTTSSAVPDPLSDRELEVLSLLAQDASNQQIADKLTISLSTVKTHVHHVLDKLGTKNRTLAMIKARETGLIGRS